MIKCGYNLLIATRGHCFQEFTLTQLSRHSACRKRSIHLKNKLLGNEKNKPQLHAQTLTEAEKRLERHPEFQHFAETFQDSKHQHVHMQQSETIQNDSYHLGSMIHRVSDQKRPHNHSKVNPLLTLSKSEFKKNPGVRITWIGLLINVGMAAGKFIGGVTFHSQALVADAVHALSDLVSDFLTLFSIGLSAKDPTIEYPRGYGKIETLGSLSVSAILTLAGLSIGWSSLCAIAGPIIPQAIMDIFVTHSHSHSHGAPEDVTNINAAWIAAGSIAVKEWIFNATKKVATQTNSNVLLANAWHHRVDSLTSLVALVTISTGYFFDIQSFDALGGLLVSGLIVKTGSDGLVSAMKELIDKAVPKSDNRYISVEKNSLEIISKMVSNNNSGKPYKLQNLAVMGSGPNIHTKMVLEVPLQRWENLLTIKEFENVADHIRSSLRENIPNLLDVELEFVEEKPQLDAKQSQEAEKQRQMGFPPLPHTEASKDTEITTTRHSHSHFGGLGDHHTHKH